MPFFAIAVSAPRPSSLTALIAPEPRPIPSIPVPKPEARLCEHQENKPVEIFGSRRILKNRVKRSKVKVAKRKLQQLIPSQK
jgi:hypothetical protein